MLEKSHKYLIDRLKETEGGLARFADQDSSAKGGALSEFKRVFAYLSAGVRYIFLQFLFALIELAILVSLPPKEGYELLVGSYRIISHEVELRKIGYEEYERRHKKARWFSLVTFSVAVVGVVAVSLVINLLTPITPSVLGATNTFTQTNWGGGSTANNAIHPTNQSGWSQYSSASSEIVAVNGGEDLELASTTASVVKTSEGDFSSGTFSNATTTGSGSVKLSKALHINEYTIGALSNINVTVSSVTTNSNGTWTIAFSGTPNLARIFKNDKFTDSASKAWKVLSVAPSVYKIIVVDSEGNTPAVSAPATGAGTVGRWYASISAWEAGRQGDITANGRNAIERGFPYYDGSPDTTAATIDGWTTDAMHYIEIYVPLPERHRGKWDNNKYGLSVTDNHAINIYEDFVRIDGLQIKLTNSTFANAGGIWVTSANSGAELWISNNIITGVLSGTTTNWGIITSYQASGNRTAKIWNNIVYNFTNGSKPAFGMDVRNGWIAYIYNNTTYNSRVGIRRYDTDNPAVVAKNNIAYNNIDNYNGTFDVASANNLSGPSQTDAPGTNPVNGATVPFVDSTNNDFHLEFRDGTGNPAMNAGADLSADANLAFTTDIDGDTRSGTWDIGADDVGVTLVMTHSIGTASRDFSTLQTWEDARDGNLTTRKVFKISGQSAAFTAGETITGLTSNATSTYVPERATPSVNETYMSLDGGSGTFQSGEVVQGGTSNATTTISAILTTQGTIERGEPYYNGAAETTTSPFAISGWTTNSSHYVSIYVPPSERHNGAWDTNKYRLEANINSSSNQAVLIASSTGGAKHIRIDGLQILGQKSGTGAVDIINLHTNDDVIGEFQVSNNILKGINNNFGSGVFTATAGTSTIWNNIIYDLTGSTGYGIYTTYAASAGNYYIYNNTIQNCGTALWRNNATQGSAIAKNNLIKGCTNATYGAWSSGTGYNSTDNASMGSSTGVGDRVNQTFSFIDESSDDFHLVPADAGAKDFGTDLSAIFKGDIDGAQIRSGSWDIGADEWFSSSPIHNATGTFESATVDFSGPVDLSSLAWNPATQSTSTALSFRIATSSDGSTWNNPYVGFDGTANTYFTTSTAATPSVLDNNRYFRYRAYLSTSDIALTPQINDITFNYKYYATSSPALISSPYNTNDATNIFGKIAWTATTTSGTEIRIQVRSAPNNGGVPGTWSSWCGYNACNDADYFATSTNNVDLGSGHSLRNGGNDQWLQYKAIFVSNGASTPTLGSITLTYVVNAPPELQNVTASQQTSDGKVAIAYEVRDQDTSTGTVTPGYITPSFSYSIDGGQNWTAITSTYLGASDLSNKSVNGSTFTQYAALWNAKSQINGTYATNTKIMVTATDNEGANNTASIASFAFVLDVRNPIAAMTVDGTKSAQEGAITTSITENSSAQMMLSNRSDYAADGLNGSSGQWIATSTSLTWSFAAGDPVRVYAKVKDAYQNETAIAPDAPNTPVNVTIQDISNLNLSEFREFISWNVSGAGDFGSYKIYRSTDGSSYSLLSTITNSATNFLQDGSAGAWLSNGTTYYYKVAALDATGNISRYSSAVSDIPDGQGGTDVTPPTISGLTSSNLNTAQATITWTTDELSDSVVYYSTDTSYSSSKSVVSMVTSHSVTLTSLSPGTAYNFRVRSTDPLGNVSSYATGTPFTTAQGPVISGVAVVSASGNSAEIVWNTNVNSDSRVTHSVNSDLSGSQTVGTSTFVGGSGPNYEHRVTLSGLNTNAKYYFKVRSVDASSNAAEDDNGGNYYTFSTAQDVSPPIISNVSAALASQTSAAISWTTNELSDSQMIYGLEPSNLTSQTAVNTTMTINHSMILNNLIAGARYYYKVISADSSGNSTQSAVYDFSTALQDVAYIKQYIYTPDVTRDQTSPLITDVAISDIKENSAVISWSTDEDATSLVEYGRTELLGKISGNFSQTRKHQVTMDGLLENTEYYARARSFDVLGNISLSKTQVFRTARQKTAAEAADEAAQAIAKKAAEGKDVAQLTKEVEQMLSDLSLKVLPPKITGAEPKAEVSSSFAVISWTTDRPANSVVAYASEKDYLSGADEPYKFSVGNVEEQVTEHQVVLSDLTPGTLYHFQARSKSFIGGTGKSADFTFRTGEEAGISGIEIRDITKNSVTIFWRTNVPATSRVEYGLSSKYGSLRDDDAYNVSHTIFLRDLEPGTFYHFRVGGTDKNGATFNSPDLTFTTESLPSLLNVKIDEVREKTMTVSWFTSVPADSTVEYTNLKTEKTETFGDKQLVKNHTIKVTGLDEDVPYKFRVISRDENGNGVESSAYNLQTARDREAPVIENIQIQSAVSGKNRVQTIVSWRTSEPASSRVTYQEGVTRKPELERSTPLDTEMKINHVVVFTDFKPGAVYRFKIESVDASSNAAQSRDLTILTPQRKETVIDLIVKNFRDVFRWTDKLR